MRPPLIPQPMPFLGNETELIKLLKRLYNTLVEYRDPQTGRILISIFMCLPSRKEFPEYFEIIKRPISMYEIQKRINNGMYQSVEPCLNDFRLMFDNCRTFNEEASMIFQDAVRLEELLFDKYDQLTAENGDCINKTKISHSPERAPPPPAPTAPAPPPPIPTPIPSTPTNNHLPSDSTKKRRLLTGYIIYAAEVRRAYVDKHPNQEFGYISRLIGQDWKALPKDLKQRYEHKALAHNAKMREKHITTNHSANRATESPRYSHSTQQEPATRRPYTDAENFKRYIQGLGVSHMDAVSEELTCFDRPSEPIESWLGVGNGRHESTEAALWALRDFMLLHSEEMRLNIQPYSFH